MAKKEVVLYVYPKDRGDIEEQLRSFGVAADDAQEVRRDIECVWRLQDRHALDSLGAWRCMKFIRQDLMEKYKGLKILL